MKKVLFLAAILMLTAVACSGGKTDSGKLKIIAATDATWPPMEIVDKDKNIVGFDIDLIKAMAKAGNFEVEIRNTAWDGIFAGLASGEYDIVISSVTITDDRKKSMDFSNPYLNAGQVLVVRSDYNGGETLDAFGGKSVGAQIGTTGAMEMNKYSDIMKKTYDEIGLAIADLANGRIDAVVCDTPIAANYALQNDKYKNNLKIVGKPFTDEYFGIAVKKGNTEVLEMINSALEKVKESGKIEEFESKWLR